MVAVLPHSLGDNDRCILWKIAKNLHAVLLAVDEAVPFLGIKAVAAANLAALLLDGLDQQGFHCLLGLFAFLVGGGA